MNDYLVFTLSANLGAMGEFAGHERRGSLDWPGRSAILGLLGAALGLRRDADFSAIERLHQAVAIFGETAPLRDFHTVQTIPSAKVKRPQSRPQALRDAHDQLNTMITLRDYRCTPLYGVALWSGDNASDLLMRIQQALTHPNFVLYLGRKSCPLSAPTAARIVQAETPDQALSHITLPPWRQGAIAHRMAADDVLPATHYEQRQDQPLNRLHWHFKSRRVALLTVHITPEKPA